MSQDLSWTSRTADGFDSSASGYINMYGASETFGSGTDKPKPLKTLGNLNTAISSLRFNHDTQLLAVASDERKDQLRLVGRVCRFYSSEASC